MLACLALLALLALGTALTLLSTLALQAGWVLLTHGASRLAIVLLRASCCPPLLACGSLLASSTLGIEGGAFHLENVFQALLQFVDERGEIVALEPFTALLLQPLEKLPDTFKTATHIAPHATPHKIA